MYFVKHLIGAEPSACWSLSDKEVSNFNPQGIYSPLRNTGILTMYLMDVRLGYITKYIFKMRTTDFGVKIEGDQGYSRLR